MMDETQTRSVEALLAVRGALPCHQYPAETPWTNAHKRQWSWSGCGTPPKIRLPGLAPATSRKRPFLTGLARPRKS